MKALPFVFNIYYFRRDDYLALIKGITSNSASFSGEYLEELVHKVLQGKLY